MLRLAYSERRAVLCFHSVRITDYPEMGLGGNPVVTITPDAEYLFTYAEGSDNVHARTWWRWPLARPRDLACLSQ